MKYLPFIVLFFQVPLLYRTDSIGQNDRNNNLDFLNSKDSNLTTVITNQNEKHNILSLSPNMYASRLRETFSNVQSFKTNNQPHISSPKSQYEVSTVSNCESPTSINLRAFDFSSFSPKSKLSPASKLDSTNQSKPVPVFQNLDELSNSNPDSVYNLEVVTEDKRETNRIVSSPSIGNISDSTSSSFNEKDDIISNSIENVETTGKEKPYKCDDCGKGFSQLRNYKYHR